MEETPAFLNDSAVLLAAQGLHEEAIACLRKGLLVEPRNSTLWFNLGLSLRATGRLPDARHALLQALRGNPVDVDTLDTLGVVLHELGEEGPAEEAYRNALELEPGSGRVWNNYGVLLFNQSRFADACQAFEKAVALIPDFEDALYNLRDTYGELGKTCLMEKCDAALKALTRTRHG